MNEETLLPFKFNGLNFMLMASLDQTFPNNAGNSALVDSLLTGLVGPNLMFSTLTACGLNNTLSLATLPIKQLSY